MKVPRANPGRWAQSLLSAGHRCSCPSSSLPSLVADLTRGSDVASPVLLANRLANLPPTEPRTAATACALERNYDMSNEHGQEA